MAAAHFQLSPKYLFLHTASASLTITIRTVRAPTLDRRNHYFSYNPITHQGYLKISGSNQTNTRNYCPVPIFATSCGLSLASSSCPKPTRRRRRVI